jgi:hypothetical protein
MKLLEDAIPFHLENRADIIGRYALHCANDAWVSNCRARNRLFDAASERRHSHNEKGAVANAHEV